MICLLKTCVGAQISPTLYAGVHGSTRLKCTILCWGFQEEPSEKGGDRPMDNDYVLVYTPYITRKGVRIWAYQYGLKAFCLRIPREKYRG